jgi:ADP-ribose pyrophosphatase
MSMSRTTFKFTEKTIQRRRVYKGLAVDFWVDKVRLPDGGTSTREYLGHPGAVAVVPVAEEGRDPQILFVKQFRYPVKQVTFEIPAGKLSAGEAPALCVRRELEEETGFAAKKYQKMLSFWPTPAFANEVIHIYVARKLVPGTFNPDEDEFIKPVVMRLSAALNKIKTGRIMDSKTIIALLAFSAFQKKK